VLEAESADAALPVLGRELVDLLFTDVVMPGEIDGFALANIALGRWPHLKVVLTSGFPETKVNGNLRVTQGGARLLTKPYRKVDLARALREALDPGRGA
jgi:CheY-like chemotaxis protein